MNSIYTPLFPLFTTLLSLLRRRTNKYFSHIFPYFSRLNSLMSIKVSRVIFHLFLLKPPDLIPFYKELKNSLVAYQTNNSPLPLCIHRYNPTLLLKFTSFTLIYLPNFTLFTTLTYFVPMATISKNFLEFLKTFPHPSHFFL